MLVAWHHAANLLTKNRIIHTRHCWDTSILWQAALVSVQNYFIKYWKAHLFKPVTSSSLARQVLETALQQAIHPTLHVNIFAREVARVKSELILQHDGSDMQAESALSCSKHVWFVSLTMLSRGSVIYFWHFALLSFWNAMKMSYLLCLGHNQTPAACLRSGVEGSKIRFWCLEHRKRIIRSQFTSARLFLLMCIVNLCNNRTGSI